MQNMRIASHPREALPSLHYVGAECSFLHLDSALGQDTGAHKTIRDQALAPISTATGICLLKGWLAGCEGMLRHLTCGLFHVLVYFLLKYTYSKVAQITRVELEELSQSKHFCILVIRLQNRTLSAPAPKRPSHAPF